MARAIASCARLELRQLQLPEQVFLQGLAGRIGEFLLPVVVVAAPGRLGGADAVLAPAVIQHLDRRSRAASSGDSSGSGVAGVLQRAAVEALLMAIVHRLEHHVGLEQLADVRLQLQGGQLQEPDRLLQLRGHRQLLTQLELQGGFQHAGTEGP